jgi:hypothetical protein
MGVVPPEPGGHRPRRAAAENEAETRRENVVQNERRSTAARPINPSSELIVFIVS